MGYPADGGEPGQCGIVPEVEGQSNPREQLGGAGRLLLLRLSVGPVVVSVTNRLVRVLAVALGVGFTAEMAAGFVEWHPADARAPVTAVASRREQRPRRHSPVRTRPARVRETRRRPAGPACPPPTPAVPSACCPCSPMSRAGTRTARPSRRSE